MLAPAFIFRAIEGEVGIAHQILDRVPVGRPDSGSDTGADIQCMMCNFVGPRQALDDFGGDLVHIADLGRIADDDGKLVAPKAADALVFADHFLQSLGNFGKQLVTDQMAEGIVHRLEPPDKRFSRLIRAAR